MSRYLKQVGRAIVLLLLAASVRATAASADTNKPTRLIVPKHLSFLQGGAPYLPVPESVLLANSFLRVADYSSFTLYKGPTANLDTVQAALREQDYEGIVATELDEIRLVGHTSIQTQVYRRRLTSEPSRHRPVLWAFTWWR